MHIKMTLFFITPPPLFNKHYINKVKAELEATMILTGCQTVKEIDSKVIYK